MEAPPAWPTFRDALKTLARRLEAFHHRLQTSPELAAGAPRAAEWLLDNQYLLAQTSQQVEEGLPKQFYQRLPALAVGSFAAKPAVHAIANALLSENEYQLDIEHAEKFVESFQSVRALKIAEVWALPLELRVVLLDNVADTAERIVERVENATRAQPTARQYADDEVHLASCIESLRAISIQNWTVFFDHVSHVERTLKGDPSRTYETMDFESRDRYRKAVEAIASGADKDEHEVAAIAVAESNRASSNFPRKRHVGYYLIAEGRDELERAVGYRRPWRSALSHWIWERRAGFYFGSIGALSAAAALTIAWYASQHGAGVWETVAVLILALVPALTFAVTVTNWMVTLTTSPVILPKLDFEAGVPNEWRTIVVTSMLLTSKKDIDNALRHVERLQLAGSDPNLRFGLLTDFTDASEPEMADDAALVEQARRGIRDLNARYRAGRQAPFYLFHRERRWNAAEGVWMGWERKRGKLQELNRLLSGDSETSFTVVDGERGELETFRFVITLDADTELPRTAAARLIGTLAHPLQRPELDRRGRVIAGYTVLQPRIETAPLTRAKSRFAKIFHESTGLDLYSHAASDVYQDLFGEGVYAGKGIYDPLAFEKSLEGRVPENALLSHDLFEGIHGRAGLVSDVAIFEDFPEHVLSYARRFHRWVRGDWLLLPWLLPRVPAALERRLPNVLDAKDRFKIADNLRRSLLAPSLSVMIVGGWLVLPGSAWAWTILALVILATPVFLGAASAAHRLLYESRLARSSGTRFVSSVRTGAGSLKGVARWFLATAFLPYEAAVMVDAIARTLIRRFITRQRILEWVPAAAAARAAQARPGLAPFFREMWMGPVLALTSSAAVFFTAPEILPIVVPLALVWASSPYLAYRLSQPFEVGCEQITSAQRSELRRVARRTWLYFEDLMGPDDHWLPPDNYQQDPGGIVARRTSPTNIGMSLLATLSAYDLGYIGVSSFSDRLHHTLVTLEKLERYRGHLFNWYNTRELATLSPRYVSTVDSGNLAAALVVARSGCTELLCDPVLRPELLTGLADTVAVLSGVARTIETPELQQQQCELVDALRMAECALTDAAGDAWAGVTPQLLHRHLPRIETALVSVAEAGTHRLPGWTLRDLRVWSEQLRSQTHQLRQEIDSLAPWLPHLAEPPRAIDAMLERAQFAAHYRVLIDGLRAVPSLAQLPALSERAQEHSRILKRCLDEPDVHSGPESVRAEARGWLDELDAALGRARETALGLGRDLDAVAAQLERWVREMDFGFLYDHDRHLFHIGYDDASGELDPHHYDLLASEARVASFLAIAKGEAPVEHWLHLGRPFGSFGESQFLISWAGTMFEYLMPSLVMRTPPGSLLHWSSSAAIERQIAYGLGLGTPWGVSESCYHQLDSHGTYQYRAFGVPRLGFGRASSERVVVAPYASVLALELRPRAVVENLRKLNELGASGTYGLFEAVDFGPREQPRTEGALVRSYMAHHQGMILCAINNYLNDQPLVARFHASPAVSTAELLLYEHVPGEIPLQAPWALEIKAGTQVAATPSFEPWRVESRTPFPEATVLSNGRYSVLVTARGAGNSRFGTVALTRWRSDPTLEQWGSWIYVRDLASGLLSSVTDEPVPGGETETVFAPHMVEFHRNVDDLSVRTRVTVTAVDDVEIRSVSIVNHSQRPRRVALTSYGELVLTAPAEDRRHPAYHRLFVEHEALRDRNALVFWRRPGAPGSEPVVVAHALVAESPTPTSVRFETDRERFLGRRGTPGYPAIFTEAGKGRADSASTSTLDPIFSIECELELAPNETRELAFITACAPTRNETLRLLRAYRTLSSVRLAFERARIREDQLLRAFELSGHELRMLQPLLSALVAPRSGLRAPGEMLARNRRSQRGLWAHGISGDRPILLVRLSRVEDLAEARRLIRAHAYWSRHNVSFDLVILDELSAGYNQPLQDELRNALERTGSRGIGETHVVFGETLTADDRRLIETTARVIVDAGRDLTSQLALLHGVSPTLPAFIPTPHAPLTQETTPPLERWRDLSFDNGLGGFTRDGREYVIHLDAGDHTPAPWINVIANDELGFLVSESGTGYTWAGNSAENRLTPWHNDPVIDPASEAIYLRDEETGTVWCPTPAPAGAPTAYRIRHGAGYSIFEHRYQGIDAELRLWVVADRPVKVAELTLTNHWARTRRITVTYYAEWTLGTSRDVAAQHVVTDYNAEEQALVARNPFSIAHGDRVAFLASSEPLHGLTSDRREFLGRDGSLARPDALHRIGLSGTAKAGDPCAALQVHIDLAPGESRNIHFLLGQGRHRREADELARHFRDAAIVADARGAVTALWDGLLGAVQVRTPEPTMDLLLNRWLLYQAIACRLWARSAFYQSSGAYGFRDQLQDVMALTHAKPRTVRAFILEAARHQFAEGDVLHWWQPHTNEGVRSRCSDDLVWLPFVASHYVEATGDIDVLREPAAFLTGPCLESHELERYAVYQPAEASASLYDHCNRALDRAMTKGVHGLPLIGTGDWNDGMNRVGVDGRGESVWLGWFLVATLRRFAPWCRRMGDRARAEELLQRAQDYVTAIELTGWDGGWYRRGYYDDGSPLGSAQNQECRIDSISQSWSVLSGGARSDRVAPAMSAVVEHLVMEEQRLVLLLTPPFGKTTKDPGYIRSYPPGVRENGGQYTHASAWVGWAFAALGDGERATWVFRLLNPILRTETARDVERYRSEPYVIAADVYGAPPHLGRGGWSWYTGSAAWLYRLGLEAILGLRRKDGGIRINPRIPPSWDSYELVVRGETGGGYKIRVHNPHGVSGGVEHVTLDGKPLPDATIPPLSDERFHDVVVRLGRAAMLDDVEGGAVRKEGER